MNALKLMRDAEKACVTDDGRALLAKWAHPGVSPPCDDRRRPRDSRAGGTKGRTMSDLLDTTILHLRERVALGLDASLTHEQAAALAGIATRDEIEHTVVTPYPGNAAPPSTALGRALADALGWAWGPAQGVPSSAEVLDGIAAELVAAGFGDLGPAWSAGWIALVEQEQQQRADATHPIMQNNPYLRCRCGHQDGEHFDEVGACGACECPRYSRRKDTP